MLSGVLYIRLAISALKSPTTIMLGWRMLAFNPIARAPLYILFNVYQYLVGVYLDMVGGIYTKAIIILSPLVGLYKPAISYFMVLQLSHTKMFSW